MHGCSSSSTSWRCTTRMMMSRYQLFCRCGHIAQVVVVAWLAPACHHNTAVAAEAAAPATHTELCCVPAGLVQVLARAAAGGRPHGDGRHEPRVRRRQHADLVLRHVGAQRAHAGKRPPAGPGPSQAPRPWPDRRMLVACAVDLSQGPLVSAVCGMLVCRAACGDAHNRAAVWAVWRFACLQGVGAPSCARMLTSWFETKERGTYWGLWWVGAVGGWLEGGATAAMQRHGRHAAPTNMLQATKAYGLWVTSTPLALGGCLPSLHAQRGRLDPPCHAHMFHAARLSCHKRGKRFVARLVGDQQVHPTNALSNMPQCVHACVPQERGAQHGRLPVSAHRRQLRARLWLAVGHVGAGPGRRCAGLVRHGCVQVRPALPCRGACLIDCSRLPCCACKGVGIGGPAAACWVGGPQAPPVPRCFRECLRLQLSLLRQ